VEKQLAYTEIRSIIMKKKSFARKLFLKKETITNLNFDEMRDSRAGGDKTDIGISCDSGLPCCNTIIPNCKPVNTNHNRSEGIHYCVD
jgi:hypothetical protein